MDDSSDYERVEIKFRRTQLLMAHLRGVSLKILTRERRSMNPLELDMNLI